MPDARFIRRTAILAKVESTVGSDASPVGGSDAMLVSNMSITPLAAQNVDRDLVRTYFGASEMLIGPANVQCSFDVEFVGSGTVATAPPWAPLVRGCGLAETLTATIRADYTPISTSIESLTIYYYDDGVLHKLLGARGTMRLMMRLGEIPKLNFTFTGVDGGATAASNPSLTLTSWKQPQVVYDAATGDITLGATHNTATAPALTGGTAYSSTGLELDLGNSIVFNPFLGGEQISLTQRIVTGRIELQLSPAQEVSLMSSVKAGTLQTLGLLHGTVANNKVGLWLPNVQLLNPAKGDRNGVRTTTLDVRALPSSGNDELRLIASYA